MLKFVDCYKSPHSYHPGSSWPHLVIPTAGKVYVTVQGGDKALGLTV